LAGWAGGRRRRQWVACELSEDSKANNGTQTHIDFNKLALISPKALTPFNCLVRLIESQESISIYNLKRTKQTNERKAVNKVKETNKKTHPFTFHSS